MKNHVQRFVVVGVKYLMVIQAAVVFIKTWAWVYLVRALNLIYLCSLKALPQYLITYHWPKAQCWLGIHGELENQIKGFWQDTQQRYNFLSHDSSRPVLDPKRLYLQNDELFALLKPHARLVLQKESSYRKRWRKYRSERAKLLDFA